MATLYELQTIYSYDDALDMYEVITINNYNESVLLNVSNRGRMQVSNGETLSDTISRLQGQTGR